MRSEKHFLGEFDSSFLSCEKDTELIVRKLLVESKPYSDELKRLLLINTKDCLDDRTNPAYLAKIRNTSIADMVDEGYIRCQPKLKMEENQEVMSYILISFDNFSAIFFCCSGSASINSDITASTLFFIKSFILVSACSELAIPYLLSAKRIFFKFSIRLIQ